MEAMVLQIVRNSVIFEVEPSKSAWDRLVRTHLKSFSRFSK